jgi:hypothetical protein
MCHRAFQSNIKVVASIIPPVESSRVGIISRACESLRQFAKQIVPRLNDCAVPARWNAPAAKFEINEIECFDILVSKACGSIRHNGIEDPSPSPPRFGSALNPFLRLHSQNRSKEGGAYDRPIADIHRCGSIGFLFLESLHLACAFS